MLAILWTCLVAWWLAPALAQNATEGITAPPPTPVLPMTERELPPELRPWVPWVRSQHPEIDCATVASRRACVWPGGLTVDARSDQARWRLSVRVDREVAIALPGGPGTWPADLRVDGRSRPVRDDSGVPTVTLRAGQHTLTARVPWSTRPGSLPVPAAVGTIGMTVDGLRIPFPRIDSDGLRLGATELDEREGENLGLEVSRRVVDGVPVVIETSLALRVSGRGREVDLGRVLVPGTRAVALSADLPARFTADGSLVIQVRPGTYRV
ncbi:MAG: hypothetical protein AAF602_01660, partial [Myxococcota bacterium]